MKIKLVRAQKVCIIKHLIGVSRHHTTILYSTLMLQKDTECYEMLPNAMKMLCYGITFRRHKGIVLVIWYYGITLVRAQKVCVAWIIKHLIGVSRHHTTLGSASCCMGSSLQSCMCVYWGSLILTYNQKVSPLLQGFCDVFLLEKSCWVMLWKRVEEVIRLAL